MSTKAEGLWICFERDCGFARASRALKDQFAAIQVERDKVPSEAEFRVACFVTYL
jgi:hypothetical protein